MALVGGWISSQASLDGLCLISGVNQTLASLGWSGPYHGVSQEVGYPIWVWSHQWCFTQKAVLPEWAWPSPCGQSSGRLFWVGVPELVV